MDNFNKNTQQTQIEEAIQKDFENWNAKVQIERDEAERKKEEYIEPVYQSDLKQEDVYNFFITTISNEIQKEEYKGLDDESIVERLNSLVEVEDKETGIIAILGNRIGQMFMGVAYAPNVATLDDVKKAKQI